MGKNRLLDELELEEKTDLVVGKGAWHTSNLGGRIPALHLSDGPNGLRKQDEGELVNNKSYTATCFPTASAVACSFNKELAYEMGQGIANEAEKAGVSVVLGPGVNIKRTPLCGRNFEYYSEDPFLAGVMGEQFVCGAQDLGIGTCIKHFAGNNQEENRMTLNAEIDERALREIYLSAFERIVKNAKPASIMAAYNRLCGEYCTENKRLLKDILRDEWGYEGVVISDWCACNDLPKSISAGMDLEMPDSGEYHRPKLAKAVREGYVPIRDVDRACERIIEFAEKYGKEEYKSGEPSKAEVPPEILALNHNLARTIAEDSAVLLKNNGALPVPVGEKLLLVGELAEKVRIQGGGSSHIAPACVPTFTETLTEEGYDVIYTRGYLESGEDDDAIKEEALKTVEKAVSEGRKVLFFGGLTDVTEGEGYDRVSYDAPLNQRKLLEEMSEICNDIILVSFGGSPYNLDIEKYCSAVLQMHLGGEAVAEAFAGLLSGRVNPSGKLAESYPYELSDTAVQNMKQPGPRDIEYRESIFVGYRYYSTYGIKVRYPFGYGLSYTTFKYSNIKVKNDRDVTFTIKNTGKVYGAEVCQLYVENPKTGIIRPVKELRGFEKVGLEPGKEKKVCITLSDRSFSVYNEDSHEFVIPEGEYRILVGSSSEDIRLSTSIMLKGSKDITYPDDIKELPSFYPKNGEKPEFSRRDFAKLYKRGIPDRKLSDFSHIKRGEYNISNSLKDLAAVSKLAAKVCEIVESVIYSRFPKDVSKDDPMVVMTIKAATEGSLDTLMINSGGIVSERIVDAMLLSANGYRIKSIIRVLHK